MTRRAGPRRAGPRRERPRRVRPGRTSSRRTRLREDHFVRRLHNESLRLSSNDYELLIQRSLSRAEADPTGEYDYIIFKLLIRCPASFEVYRDAALFLTRSASRGWFQACLTKSYYYEKGLLEPFIHRNLNSAIILCLHAYVGSGQLNWIQQKLLGLIEGKSRTLLCDFQEACCSLSDLNSQDGVLLSYCLAEISSEVQSIRMLHLRCNIDAFADLAITRSFNETLDHYCNLYGDMYQLVHGFREQLDQRSAQTAILPSVHSTFYSPTKQQRLTTEDDANNEDSKSTLMNNFPD